ncbi:MAG: hypothetical protein ACJ71L_05490 [Nitrososphaeraceae archaeon]
MLVMGDLLLGCSGWNYGHTPENGGGWTGVFYPDANTKRLRYYSQFFNTTEIDSTFYEKFYTYMTKGTCPKQLQRNSSSQSRFQKLLLILRGLELNWGPSVILKIFSTRYHH